ncbi:MAG: hypothetical protein H6619_03345 [Deltaproteobacteria bacterium]|nr:hypothetical protein [Deltaproteobacteria bacterium]
MDTSLVLLPQEGSVGGRESISTDTISVRCIDSVSGADVSAPQIDWMESLSYESGHGGTLPGPGSYLLRVTAPGYLSHLRFHDVDRALQIELIPEAVLRIELNRRTPLQVELIPDGKERIDQSMREQLRMSDRAVSIATNALLSGEVSGEYRELTAQQLDQALIHYGFESMVRSEEGLVEFRAPPGRYRYRVIEPQKVEVTPAHEEQPVTVTEEGFEINPESSGNVRISGVLELKPGKETKVVLQGAIDSSIRGRVTLGPGSPLLKSMSAQVVLLGVHRVQGKQESFTDRPIEASLTTSDGYFEFDHVAPGEKTLHAIISSGKPGSESSLSIALTSFVLNEDEQRDLGEIFPNGTSLQVQVDVVNEKGERLSPHDVFSAELPRLPVTATIMGPNQPNRAFANLWLMVYPGQSIWLHGLPQGRVTLTWNFTPSKVALVAPYKFAKLEPQQVQVPQPYCQLKLPVTVQKDRHYELMLAVPGAPDMTRPPYGWLVNVETRKATKLQFGAYTNGIQTALVDLPQGHYELLAAVQTSTGSYRAQEMVEIGELESLGIFNCEPAISFKGRLVNSGGEPAAYSTIRFASASLDGTTLLPYLQHAVSNRDGVFQLWGAKPGELLYLDLLDAKITVPLIQPEQDAVLGNIPLPE